MNTFLSPYVVAVATGLAGVALMGIAAGANRLLAPRGGAAEPMPAADIEPDGAERRVRAHVPHYIAALVCAVVAAGVAYLFPWAAVFAAPGFGVPAVAAMAAFAVFPAAGAVYAVKRGVGTWR